MKKIVPSFLALLTSDHPLPRNVRNVRNDTLDTQAIADLVSHRDAKVLAGETCRLTFSALELYNERLADLMTCASARGCAESSASSLRVVADPRRGVWPRGAAEILLGDDVDVEALLETVSARRSTGATDLNKDSSRSHLVVILRMETATCHSKLFLVDLAGCEQVRRSGAAGSRLDEACGINKSLSALGNVVAALTAAKTEDDLSASADASPAKEKEKKKGSVQHVPYRDSKLTYLLSEALGGNARAVLVTCLSPSVADAAESLSTLRFGVRARRIVARPKRNVNASPEKASPGASAAAAAAAAAELAELRSEVATLRRRLEAARDDQKDASASSAKIIDRDTYPYARVKHMPTFRLWVGLCVAYFAVDALVLWA